MTLGIIVKKKNLSVELMANLDMVIYALAVGDIYSLNKGFLNSYYNYAICQI